LNKEKEFEAWLKGWVMGYDLADEAAKALGVDIGTAYRVPIGLALKRITKINTSRKQEGK
jgi:tetrahydromethanopterin S-methyltransferase subunit G